MILPTACINWAALRSGLSLSDFMASLNPEREEEILKSYNAWKKSKGLPEARPCVPKPPVAPTPTTPPKPPVAVEQPLMKGEDKREPQDDDADEPQEDDISDLVSKIADQVAQEELEDTELIQEALRMPEERIPQELEEKLAAAAPSEVATTAPQAAVAPQVETVTAPSEVANTAPQAAIAPQVETVTASSEAASTEPAEPTTASEKPSTKKESPTTAPQVEPDGPIMEADISERFLSIARTLPKVADPEVYEGILSELAEPLDVVKSLAEETQKLYTAKHRSIVGLRAFIEWLSKDFHQTDEQ